MNPRRPLFARFWLTTCLSLGLTLSPALAQETETPGAADNAGAYLAARFAETQQDFAASAEWFAKALTFDPTNARLLQGLLVAQLSLGRFDLAPATANTFLQKGETNNSVALALLTDRAMAADYAGLLDLRANGQTVGAGLDDLIAGWAELGLGRMSEASAHFDKVIASPGFQGVGLYQKALALATVGDLEGADAILSSPEGASVHSFRRGVLAHLQILSQLERNADAVALFDAAFTGAPDPDLVDLRRRLAAGEPIAFTIVRDAKEGLAEALFSYATAITEFADGNVTLAFSQSALFLRPDQTEVKLLVADLLSSLGQHRLAADAFALVPPEDVAFFSAEIGRAQALQLAGDTDGAIAALEALAQSHGQLVQVHLALGDILRRNEDYERALAAYDAGIALIKDPAPWSWPLHYNRAVCLERLGRFDEGVPSFRKALELAPNQPQVLNYLGYTWIDRGENLDEAVTMIEAAVKGAPDQGYIIDSLAWAYYRLGRFADALPVIEKASLLEPVDPVVTDHLGDIYWANGRKLEAQFQWQRALSFEPTETDAVRIRLKLEKGLDAVLEQEKAAGGASD